MLFIVNTLATIPVSAIEIGQIPPSLVWVYYLLLASIIWVIWRYNWRLNILTAIPLTFMISGGYKATNAHTKILKRYAVFPLLIVAIVTSLIALKTSDDNLHVSFLAVGNGDAILIQTPNHQDILVDGGASAQDINLELGQKLPLWDRTIDMVILTHAHADHITGLVEVLRRYRVEHVLLPDVTDVTPVYDELQILIKSKNIQHTIARSGQQIKLDDEVTLSVLNPQHPPFSGTQSDIDNNSVVLHASMGAIRFLLTSDIMWEAEFALLNERADLTVTVLKVAHNGSSTSTTPEFLTVVNPQIAVFSLGTNSPQTHPSPQVIARLEDRIGSENIYRTDEYGSIEFITDGETLWMKTTR